MEFKGYGTSIEIGEGLKVISDPYGLSSSGIGVFL